MDSKRLSKNRTRLSGERLLSMGLQRRPYCIAGELANRNLQDRIQDKRLTITHVC